MKELISNTIPSIANNNILLEGGVIYLPFQISIFTEIVAHYDILREKYSISFDECTSNNTLWSCTQNIVATEMIDVFEKTIDQEEKYCTTKGSRNNTEWIDKCGTNRRFAGNIFSY